MGSFARAGTPISPYSASTTLVTAGPFRITRNPAYLGMAMVYSGIAVSAEALWALVPLLAVIDRGVIVRDERYLDRTRRRVPPLPAADAAPALNADGRSGPG